MLRKIGLAFVALLAMVMGAGVMFGGGDRPRPSSEAGMQSANPYDAKAAAEAKPPSAALAKATAPQVDRREQAWQRAQLLAALIRKAANDPKSIEFADAFYTEDGTIALEYRGKNAFGALVLNKAVMTPDGKTATGSDSKVADLWNRRVAGKTSYSLPTP